MDPAKDQQWKPPEDWTREHRLIWDLGFFGHYLHQSGGRSGQKRILTRLAKHGGSLDQRAIQDMFDIKSGSLSEVLAKLEADGLIERQRSEEDARKLVVVLTPAGWASAKQCEGEMQDFEGRALSCLTDGERDELLVTLDRLIDHWNHLNTNEGKGE